VSRFRSEVCGFALAILLGSGCSRPTERPALHKAARYLWNQQSADGSWPSHTYGLLRSGQSLTPFVLEALLEVPESVYPLPVHKVDRAIEFIRRKTDSQGTLGMADPGLPDYPNYATALAVTALTRAKRTDWQVQAAPMVESLKRSQFSESTGWKPADPAYGAWGFGGIEHPPPNPGHVDLSMTRYVLEALALSGIDSKDAVFVRARTFVERCQNFDPAKPDDLDGGFFFTNTEVETNKAGQVSDHFRSYGTTTADGIISLLAIGRPLDDPRVRAAQRWLTAHHRDMDVPGFIGEAYQRWPKGLAFYYAAASTAAFRQLHISVPSAVPDALMRLQRTDGSWANPENLVKEDDPLIATAFAVRTLANQ